ncbi:hypothetical protein LSH36_184g12004 [Paralvinella palmiformis]|uniref:Protein kinase domain-containing protein n=1 Tax=Paralvinella palmiformis TaxID=53620 RepID=A0AAD9JRW4_9ANNE|nr:hypothetical protein LSH36_184g12004 [Paralvinella palmiformis]
MNRVSGGELFEYLSERDKVQEDEAVEFLKQILEGIKHLHDRNIVHLDLKPENLMLLHQESTRLKLIDFGLSRILNSKAECRELLGTPEFVAISYTFETPDFSNTSDLAKDFISKLLVRDPRNRASVDDCLDHPWIKPVEEQHTSSRRSSSINVDNLKSFIARQRWKVRISLSCGV